MSGNPRIQPVTRIRGELRPSASLEKSVNRLLETPFAPGAMKLFTTAQAIVDQAEYRRHRYDMDMRDIEHEMRSRSLAQRAFVLAGPLRLLEGKNGNGRLFFNVQTKDRPVIHRVGENLRAMESLEESPDDDLLYVEFARGALARDRNKRREQLRQGGALLASELRHPTAGFRMTATGLHIVTKDMLYPVRTGEAPLPAAE
ncbi:MAG TPA: hypothetical protein VL481_01840 [Verrucomicrobiae bacterium]|nr:hypothetical protein [Verrucomicrobiae bacterium]